MPLSGLVKFSFAPTNGSPANWKGLVESSSQYLCAKDKSPKAVELHELESKGSGDLPAVEVRAKTDLPADEWCWLVVQQGPDLRVGADGKATGSWSTHFFTGSALRPVRVQFTSKVPNVISIAFSEPFDADQVVGKKIVDCGTSLKAECVLRGTECAVAGQQFLTSALDIRLSGPAAAIPTSVLLPSVVQGSGRDVAAGAAATGDSVAEGVLKLQIGSTNWTSCHDGNATCWTDEKAPPAY